MDLLSITRLWPPFAGQAGAPATPARAFDLLSIAGPWPPFAASRAPSAAPRKGPARFASTATRVGPDPRRSTSA